MPNPETSELSERELEILKLIATGVSNKEIAQKLFISSNTVKVHLRNIFNKIGVTTRTEAAMYAVRIGLVAAASSQISSEEESALGNDKSVLSPQQTVPFENVTPQKNRNTLVIFISLSLLVIILLIGYIYQHNINITSNTSILPTPTVRIQWLQLPDLPTPRRGIAVASYGTHLYAIGGESAQGITDVNQQLDLQTNTWSNLSSKPTPVSEISAAVISGLIYIPGGKLLDGAPTNITEIFDPNTNQWHSGVPLPKPLSAYALVVYEGRIYIFGGWDGTKVVNSSYMFDPRYNSWTNLPPMPTSRSLAGAAAVGNRIYVIGGWNGIEALTINEIFQPDISGSNVQWITGIPLPSARFALAASTIADVIVVIGGTNTEDSLTTIALSQEDANWGQLEAPIPRGWSSLGAVAVGSRLYVLGGNTNTGLCTQVWSYQAIFTITLPIIR